MGMSSILNIVIGILIGIVITMIAVKVLMPRLMLRTHESLHDLSTTVDMISTNATNSGWQVPKIYDIQNTLAKAGYTEMTELQVVSMCEPDHAYSILQDDDNKMVSGIMPCRVGVYRTGDGKVMVSQMNVGLVSRLFGGKIAEVMGKVAKQEREILQGVISG